MRTRIDKRCASAYVLIMDAALMPLHTTRLPMQYRTDIDTSRLYVIDTPCHSLREAAADGLNELVASMESGGYDTNRPVILVCNNYTMERLGWQMNSDDEVTIAQGRHRWLASMEAGLDAIAAILVTHSEWETLREDGDANDIEILLLANLSALIARGDEGEQLAVNELVAMP